MDRELVCCVRLQLLLYFSVWYDVLFALIHFVVAWYKWRFIKGPVVVTTFFLNLSLCAVLEPFRLYLGYAGNLFERVPELFLFNIFCIVPCLGLLGTNFALVIVLPDMQPAQCSLVPDKPCVLPIEKACWGFQIIMVFAEFVFGIRALKRLIREQSARFFRSLEAADAMDGVVTCDTEDESPAMWATTTNASAPAPAPPLSLALAEPARLADGYVSAEGAPTRMYGKQCYSPLRQTNDSHLHAD
eukprot:TRINITY_DN15124_c0_g1_i1.p1 TRINITY_DN15124_c0_g1~~TRINITY_DN15124_c0_g1_i1.p1  ORF type:complete len:244 (-),score=33.37 TRINITY_DN15124_c0_g1_i1:333-1064(-)